MRSWGHFLFVFMLALSASSARAVTLEGVRMHEAPDSTRVVFDTSHAVKYNVFSLKEPERVVVDLIDVQPEISFDPSVVAVGRKRVSGLRAGQRNNNYRIVIETKEALDPKAFTLRPIEPYGHRLVVDLLVKAQAVVATREPRRSESRDIVIAVDAGHGGDDPGAIGPNKVYEKRVVLQLAKRIVRELDGKLGFDGVLTRTGDYYLGHRKRTQIARESRADLFVSIHADAFKSANVKGASVYTLSDRGASSETAAWLAERENRSDLLGGVGDVSLGDKDPVLAQVLLDLSMDANRSQSINAGKAVLANLGQITKLHKSRVEQAAFVVLKSPDMPSLLVETGFISNPDEARQLSQAEHQDKVARAVARGIEQFMRANPPPGTLLAQRSLGAEFRYTIVRGDTLSAIAQRFGVSSGMLRRHNELRGDKIRIGQVLRIPGGA
jgi:N-acetylmuramoyl-L-alanine amidase